MEVERWKETDGDRGEGMGRKMVRERGMDPDKEGD